MFRRIRGHRNAARLRRAVIVAALPLSFGACGDCPDAFELSERSAVRPDEAIGTTTPDGELTILGRERAATIELDARGCRARGGARIAMDSTAGRRLRVDAPHADVRATVPAGSEMFVTHGSGDVELRALGPTTVVVRGGDVRIDQIVGLVRVRAGAGTLYVRDVIGDVEIIDGPGAVFVEGIAGSVTVRDGSGGIYLREIEGDVFIESDGSGAIEARTIGGDFVVRAKLGDPRQIRYDDVAGSVRLPR